MGWSFKRYRDATITEYILASGGYWRNWERQIVWPLRELIYTNICLDPYLSAADKPGKKDLYKLTIDKIPVVDLDETIQAAQDYENKLKRGLYNG